MSRETARPQTSRRQRSNAVRSRQVSSDVSWRLTIVVTTVLAALAAVAISGVRTGPALPPSPPLDMRAAARASATTGRCA